MKANQPPKKLRGTPVGIPDWWLEEVNRRWARLHEGPEKWGMQRLANALTLAVDRRFQGKPYRWDRKTVERFLDNDNTTIELMDAFCEFFEDLIPPVFVAHSAAEAAALYRASETYRGPDPTPEKLRRRATLIEAREQLEAQINRQGEALHSTDDGSESATGRKTHRRTRGMVRGRSTPS